MCNRQRLRLRARSLLLGRCTVHEKAESRVLRGTSTTHFYCFTSLIRAELCDRLRAVTLRAVPLAVGSRFRRTLHAPPVPLPGLLAGIFVPGPLDGPDGVPRPSRTVAPLQRPTRPCNPHSVCNRVSLNVAFYLEFLASTLMVLFL